jgi:hypothetical protein
MAAAERPLGVTRLVPWQLGLDEKPSQPVPVRRPKAFAWRSDVLGYSQKREAGNICRLRPHGRRRSDGLPIRTFVPSQIIRLKRVAGSIFECFW